MEWVWITAAIGIMASVWGYIKAILSKIIGCFITTYEFSDGSSSITHWINVKSTISKNYRRQINQVWNTSKKEWIAYEDLNNSFYLYWYGWIPFIVYKQEYDPQKKSTTELKQLAEKPLKVSFIRGTIDFDTWIKEAWTDLARRNKEQSENKQANRYCVAEVTDYQGVTTQADFFWNPAKSYNVLSHDIKEMMPSRNTDMLDRLVYNEKVQKAINFALIWKNSKDWYKQKGIDWKTGMVLHGEPGTGKTKLAKAIAQAMNVPIVPMNLVGMSDTEFRKVWKNLRGAAPCVVLFEDFDNIFHGRVNVTDQIDPLISAISSVSSSSTVEAPGASSPKKPMQKLNFSTLLNCLDGIDNIDGIFIIITTNDISKVDTALKNRPGRTDFNLELTKMPMCDKLKLAEKILGYNSEQYMEFINLTPTEDETPAIVEQRCKEISLQYLYRDNK